ncbi:hypothetical protein BU17DRAFT_69782 [Hysterangium stoloniferum]|nr:hypothetical protein BU17DRAFT_69782 [Hysterangium stoloniferum]
MIAPTTPPVPSVPLPRIYEDDSGRCWEEYIPLPPIHEDDSGRCHAEHIPPPPLPFLYIPLPPIGEDESVRWNRLVTTPTCPSSGWRDTYNCPHFPQIETRVVPWFTYETPVDVRCSAVVSHKDPIEARALRPSEGLPRARATVPSMFISDRSQVTEPVFLPNGLRRTDDRNILRMLVTIDGKQHNALTPRHHHANFAKRHGCVTHP